MTNNDPRLALIKSVIQSADGLKAMVLAISKSLPALAGVDRLLRDTAGADYQTDGAVRQEAGWRVAQEMKEMGFVVISDEDMPAGSATVKAKRFGFPAP